MATRGRPRGSSGKRSSVPAAASEGSDSGAAKKKKTYKGQTFLPSYTQAYPCIVPSRLGNNYAKCNVCVLDFVISHGGFDDVNKHVKSMRHTSKAAALKNSSSLMGLMGAKDDDSTKLKVIRAETLFTNFLVEHNIPLSASDHAGALFREMFPDSAIAEAYSCAKTKTASIVKECAKECKTQLVDCMLKGPFVIGTDGSQEGEDKSFPIADFRGAMGAETMDALMVLKVRSEGPCYSAKFSDDLLRRCKSATRRQLAQQAEQRPSTSTSQ